MGANTDATASSKSELDRYLGEAQEPSNIKFDTLNFWKNNQLKYPILSSLAKDYLRIQPTSVPSERSFSQGGLTVTKVRNRQKIMCLKSWLNADE